MGFLTSNEDFGLALGLAENIRDARRKLRAQSALIADLEAQLNLEKMRSAGRFAIMKAFEKAHPASPLLAETGRHYRNGAPILAKNALFAEGFDAQGRQLGIRSPEEWRTQ